MRMARGCGWVMLLLMAAIVACLIFGSLATGLFLTGELPLYGPHLTGLQPDPNSEFSPLTPITLTFDQPMDTASVEAAFVLEPDMTGTFSWNEDLSQVIFTPVGEGFEPGTTYSARLKAGAKAGTFPRYTTRTVQWFFSLPPLLDSLKPPPGAEELGPQPILEATFHYPLDCTATFRTFSITPEVVGLLKCKDNVLAFDPAQSLEAGTRYAAALGHVFLEADSTPRPGVQWEFHTAPPLAVVDVLPEEAGFLTDLWSPFSVAFSRPVEPESAVARFSLAAVGGGPVDGDISWRQDGSVLVFQPKQPLRPAMQYELTLDSGVQDELGYELEESRRWSYGTPPMLGLPLPLSESRNVALDSTIRVPFARPMDKESVEAGFVVSPALHGEMVWEEDTLVFIPRGGFSPETEYQVEMRADIRDATGAPLAESHQWTFQTEPFLVEAVVPSGPVVTQLQQPVQFTFALPMERASVRAALTISPTTPGDLMWSEEGRTVTFLPQPAWLPGTDYEVRLAGTARTADGFQTLGDEVGYAFATGVADVRFGDGPNVQVVATEGDRSFQVLAQGADVADFRMYSIMPTQFLDLYDSESVGTDERRPELLASSTLTPSVSWREPLSALGSPIRGEWQPAEAHIPADAPTGLYVLSAEPPSGLQDQLLVVLTEHAVVIKRALAGVGVRADAQIVVWDTTIDDGRPVVSATVRLYDRDANVVAEGVTDGTGLLSLTVPGEPGPSLVLSEKDGDVTVVGLAPEWSEVDWGPGDWHPSRPEYLIYAFTDQVVYRPSGTIYFKQFVRADDDVQYTLPAPDLPITVRLRDARDNIVASQVLTATEFGTTYGSFELTDKPMLGQWNLETEVGGTLIRTPFQVEQSRGFDFEGDSGALEESRADKASNLLPGARQGSIPDTSDLAPGRQVIRSADSQISIEMGGQAFASGQDVQVSISTPVSGTALVSLERSKVHHVETVSLVSGTNLITLAVQANYAPNVELSVSQFGPVEGESDGRESRSDLELRTAHAHLPVPMEDRRMTISLRSDQEAYSPGDDAVLHVEVQDQQGEPVVAEVSLALVDKATYALYEELTPDVFEVFYGPQPSLVGTYDSMRPTRRLVSEEPWTGDPPSAVEHVEERAPYGAFFDTPYWIPVVVTDPQGAAEITIQVPDNLARWMVMARGITTDTLVGEASSQLVVTQEISVRPQVPEFLVQGDVFSVTAEVHNFTAHPVSATLQLEQEGLEAWDTGNQILHLPAGGAARAIWPAMAARPGQAQIALEATASRGTRVIGRDVAEVTLGIEPFVLAESMIWSGVLMPDNPARTITLTVPADRSMSLDGIEIGMSPSVIPAVLEGLVYLVKHPNACVEQTVSEVVASASVAEASDGLSGPALVAEAEFPSTVLLGLQRLYGYQHDDGGWGWCHSAGSDAFQTAYALQGLASIGEAGFEVDEGVMGRAVEALRLMLPETDPGTRAYGAYALMMAGQPVTLTLNVTDTLQLDAFSQAALAIAVDVRGEGDTVPDPLQDLGSALLESLEESAIEDADTAHWEGTGQEVGTAQTAMGSPVRTTAFVVQALLRLDPESDLVPKAVRWLMGQREGKGWGDTQRTSYTILALVDYVRALEPEAPATGFQVILNGELWDEGQIDPLLVQEVLTVPVSVLARGANELQLVLGSEEAVSGGLLYYAVTATSVLTPTEGAFAAAQGRDPGIGVRRFYRLPGGEESVTEFEAGDLVEVVIVLDIPEEAWRIVLEDTLPAGFEALDEWQQTGGDVGIQPEEPSSGGFATDYDRLDVGVDRVAFFIEHLEAGSRTFTYLVRATVGGRFTALPATVYPMYDAQGWSRSASLDCNVEAR